MQNATLQRSQLNSLQTAGKGRQQGLAGVDFRLSAAYRPLTLPTSWLNACNYS